MSLSDKITLFALYNGIPAELYQQEDVKEFVKKARQLLDDTMSGGCDREMVLKQFDDSAGDALVGENE